MATLTAPAVKPRRPRAGRAGGLMAAGWLTYSILAVVILVSIFPFLWTIVAASTSNTEINQIPPNLVPGPNLTKNFREALTNVNMGKALLNSTIVSGAIAAGTVMFGTLAGFAFAKLRFRGRNILLFVTIGTTGGGWQYDDAAAIGLTKRFYRVLPVPYSVNLIANGNAELGPGSSTGQPVLLVPAWVTTGPFTVVPYTAGGGFPTASDPGPPDRLNQFFAGGSGALSTASQDIDVSGNASDINPGKVTCDLSGWFGGFLTDEDNATLTLTFFDGVNNLGSFIIGPVTASQRGNQTGLLLRSLTGLQVPPNTTRLHLVLTMTRASGAFNDAYADSLSLVLHVQ
jgi:hypothetical protein